MTGVYGVFGRFEGGPRIELFGSTTPVPNVPAFFKHWFDYVEICELSPEELETRNQRVLRHREIRQHENSD